MLHRRRPVGLLFAAALVLPLLGEAEARPKASASVGNASASSPKAPRKDGSKGSTARATTPKPRGGAPRTVARSVGSPTSGRLVSGARLDDAPYLRVYPVYAGNDARWGLDALVSMVDRAGRSVRRQFPDAVLSVGHLSKAGGGELQRHASHESGRDVDIGFFVKNQAGKPIYSDHMVSFRGDGTCGTWPGARFDDARNWALVAALVSDPGVRIARLFVATPIRARLLAYAAKIGAPASVRSRAAEVMAQPRGALPHDDHFHVRIACPGGMDGCVELPTPKRRRASVVAKGTPRESVKPQEIAKEAKKPRVAPGPPTPARPAASPPAPRDPRDERDDGDERDDAEATTSSRESFIPSLAPIVPGLDSAVIPAPLGGGVRVPWATPKVAPEADDRKDGPGGDAVSDPDGVLDESK